MDKGSNLASSRTVTIDYNVLEIQKFQIFKSTFSVDTPTAKRLFNSLRHKSLITTKPRRFDRIQGKTGAQPGFEFEIQDACL
jgi:hypothetical protein